jgi:hypothetical protein
MCHQFPFVGELLPHFTAQDCHGFHPPALTSKCSLFVCLVTYSVPQTVESNGRKNNDNEFEIMWKETVTA